MTHAMRATRTRRMRTGVAASIPRRIMPKPGRVMQRAVLGALRGSEVRNRLLDAQALAGDVRAASRTLLRAADGFLAMTTVCRRIRFFAPPQAVSVFSRGAHVFSVCQPDRRGRGRLASLRADVSAFVLGMVGLVQFLPTAVLVFVAGHAADRFDRKRVVQLCQFVEGADRGLPGVGHLCRMADGARDLHRHAGGRHRRCFESPAVAALLPAVVPNGTLQRATAISSGFGAARDHHRAGARRLCLRRRAWPALCHHGRVLGDRRPARSARSALTSGRAARNVAGFGRSVRRRQIRLGNPAILGTISLDLFAVLLGGATALLPIYARDILQTGPWGLGSCAPRPPSARCS